MIEGYKKLLNELNLHKRLREAFQSEYEYNQRVFGSHLENTNSIDRFGNEKTIKSLDRVVADLRYYENLIYLETENINRLEGQIKAIDECINQSDITIKVAQLRALGMKQEDIAELIDRTDRQVRRIEAKLREN